VPFFPPELEDRDWLMDQDCQICDQRIFADFEFVPKLKAVYRLTAMPGCVDISAEAAHASD
jgi:hypothetical protein